MSVRTRFKMIAHESRRKRSVCIKFCECRKSHCGTGVSVKSCLTAANLEAMEAGNSPRARVCNSPLKWKRDLTAADAIANFIPRITQPHGLPKPRCGLVERLRRSPLHVLQRRR